MMRSVGTTRRPDALEYALLTGAVTIRQAVIRDGRRFRIDARDERHTVVWVRHDLPMREARSAREAIMTELGRVLERRRRRELVPVAELEGDESFLDDLGETGTEGATELAAHQRRRTFGLIPGEG